MSSQTERFIGRRYGRLIVRKVARFEGFKVMWLCDCDCGRHAVVSDGDLTRGRILTCGRELCEAILAADRKVPTYES